MSTAFAVSALRAISESCARREHSSVVRKRHQFKAALLMLDWMTLNTVAMAYSRYLPRNWNPIENGNTLQGIIIFSVVAVVISLMLLPLMLIRNLWIHGIIFLVALSVFFYAVGFFKMWGWV